MSRILTFRIVGIIYIFTQGWLVSFGQDIELNTFNKGILYSTRNIAIPFPKKNNIVLPEIGAKILNELGNSNEWSGNSGSHVRTLNLQNIWKSMSRKQYLTSLNWNIQSIAFGKKYNRFQWMISHKINGDLDFLYHKDLIGILAYGNYGYLQQEPLAKTQALDIKPTSLISVYQSIGVDGAYFINDQNAIGAGIHYLSGWYNFTTAVKKFEVDIRDPLTIKANEDWSVRTANLVDHLSVDSLKVNANQAEWGRHPGVGINLGFSHHTDRLQLGIQVRDLGMITWKGSVYSRKAVTEYSGIKVNDILNINRNIFDHITDSLKAIATVDQSSSTYHTTLNSKIILDAQYDLSDHWTMGGAFLYSKGNIRDYWKLVTGVDYKLLSFLNVGANVSIDKYSTVDLGILGALRVSIVHFYFNFSPIQAFWNINEYNRASARVGLSVQWQK